MSRKKVTGFLCICLPFLLFVWMTHNYFVARMELIEARHLDAFIFLKAAHARQLILNGDTNSASVAINDGLRKVVQYAIRREVMDSHLNSRLRSIVIRQEVDMTNEERNLFRNYYDDTYAKWNDSRWCGRNLPPILNQIEDILYSNWSDRIELWKTWYPNDRASNIKVLSKAEYRMRQELIKPEPVAPLLDKFNRALGRDGGTFNVTGTVDKVKSYQNVFDNAVQHANAYDMSTTNRNR